MEAALLMLGRSLEIARRLRDHLKAFRPEQVAQRYECFRAEAVSSNGNLTLEKHELYFSSCRKYYVCVLDKSCILGRVVGDSVVNQCLFPPDETEKPARVARG